MRSTAEIAVTLGRLPEKEAIKELWALHYFVEQTVYSRGGETNPSWAELIVLTEEGQELCQEVLARDSGLTEADAKLALFGLFFFRDLLIDCGATQPPLIAQQIEKDAAEGKFKWPYRFGRLLYDRFSELGSSSVNRLSPDEVRALLDGTPAGVYSVGPYVSGPLGLLVSSESRFLPPSNELSLWHCSDTGCMAAHRVYLDPTPVPVVRAYAACLEIAEQNRGDRSSWYRPLNRLFKKRGRRSAVPYDLPVLLANSLIGAERVALVSAALRSGSADLIRAALAGKRSSGSPEAIAESLPDAEQLQVLLLLSDEELVQLLDKVVLTRSVTIPPGEIRNAMISPPKLSQRDRPGELSALGVRCRPQMPVVSLHSIIWSSYEQAGLLEELGWKLRQRTGLPPPSTLMDYIGLKNPTETVNELILKSMPVAKAVAQKLHLQLDAADSESLLDRLLWKIGFDPSSYDETYSRLRARIEEFSEVIAPLREIRSEEERERVRAIGVNLFVSVEHFIQELIAYNVWLLSNDHFLSRFVYHRSTAYSAVASELGEEILSGEQAFRWDWRGTNTLGTSLAYLRRMVEWVEDLSKADKSTAQRSDEDLPFFAEESEQLFLFRHTKLWADADNQELQAYLEILNEVVAQLNRSELALVRNAIDHSRESVEFPSPDLMIACATRLKTALNQADSARLIPKEFWLSTKSSDRFGREIFQFVDYRGQEVSMGGPPVVSGLPRPKFGIPTLIAPGNLLGQPNADLRFTITQKTAFSEYWLGYPKRRRLADSADDTLITGRLAPSEENLQ